MQPLVERLHLQREWLDQAAPVAAPAGTFEAAFPDQLHCPYTWMQRSAHALSLEQETLALQCWFQASRCLPAQWDPDALAVLGLGDAQTLRARSSEMAQRRAQHLKHSLDSLRDAHGSAAVFRIDRALAGYLGQARVFSSHPTQKPKVIYIPGLSTSGFVDPRTISLARDLAAAYHVIREEFDAALSMQDPHEPFMGRLSKDKEKEYVSGGLRASWDAIFFDRHGRRHAPTHERYLRTSAVLDSADRCRIEHQAPETCFSILQPYTRIEPHYGVTNARLVVHLPLRVPDGCYLELVGVGRHHWREGEVFAFDDTFFHAAENPTDQVRGILLTDAWHPELTSVERNAFTALITRITALESAPAASHAT
jgi:aspartate beta-hydroxylase